VGGLLLRPLHRQQSKLVRRKEKEAHTNSPPISCQSDAVQDKTFSCDDGDIESSLTSDIRSSHPIQGVPNDVSLFGNARAYARGGGGVGLKNPP